MLKVVARFLVFQLPTQSSCYLCYFYTGSSKQNTRSPPKERLKKQNTPIQNDQSSESSSESESANAVETHELKKSVFKPANDYLQLAKQAHELEAAVLGGEDDVLATLAVDDKPDSLSKTKTQVINQLVHRDYIQWWVCCM